MWNYKDKSTIDKKNINAEFPYMVLALSILITAGIAYNFYQNALNKDSIRFNNRVAQTQFAIENKINLYVALLKSGRGFIESSNEMNEKIFAVYVNSLEIEKNYPGLQAIGYSKIDSAADFASITNPLNIPVDSAARTLAENKRKSFSILIPVKHAEKKIDEEKRFDIASDINLNNAFERAKASGKPVLSSKVKFYRDGEQSESGGFFMVLPVYAKSKFTRTTGEQERKLSGYIFGVVGADDFLAEAKTNVAPDIVGVKIYETENKPDNLLAQSGFVNNNVNNKKISLSDNKDFTADEKSNFTKLEEIHAGGKKWIVEYDSLPAFAEESDAVWTLLVVLTGVFFSLLLFSIIYTEVSARLNLQETAGKLMELQRQKQVLLENEQSARKSAESANRTKDEFIAVVSHELKTPLNAISGWTNILRTENLPDDTKKLAIEKIEKNLHAQAALVEEMLEYSQIVSGTINLNRKQINFCELFDKTFIDFEPKARAKNIELVKENQSDGHSILGDDEKIKLVIGNIFSNAIKFTHPGGRIKAIITEAEGNLQMCIKDNGDGISAEFLPFIFEKFRQADASITRTNGGLGLGLTISHHIVKLHEGTIEVNSEGKGKGSAFIVKLPLLLHDA